MIHFFVHVVNTTGCMICMSVYSIRTYIVRTYIRISHVLLVQKGQGAPAREPVVDEETQKKMMQIAYKRQEELKVCELNKR